MDLDRALREAESWLDAVAGIEKVAQGDKDDRRCIMVFGSTEETAARMPGELHEVPVVVERSGPFTAGDGDPRCTPTDASRG